MRLNEFWDWFEEISVALSADPNNGKLLGELDHRITEIDRRLTWEIGPGEREEWQLVISPNLNRDLRALARRVVSHAPSIENWEFHSARLPKDWDYKFELDAEDGSIVKHFDASRWTFVLLEYPDKGHEVLLKSPSAASLSADQRDCAASIVLVAVLGEDLFLDYVEWYDLVEEFEPRFAKKQKPVALLRDAVLGTSMRRRSTDHT